MGAIANRVREVLTDSTSALAVAPFLAARVLSVRVPVALALALALASVGAASSETSFFENRVRPVLAEHCYRCHSAEAKEVKGQLRVDSLEGLMRGGTRGPAIMPGYPDHSLLLQAVRHAEPDLEMPAEGKRLSPRQIADLREWIKQGAPWPTPAARGEGMAARPAGPANAKATDDKMWWAFQPVKRPAVPHRPSRNEAVHPIDAFIGASLAEKGLKPNPAASRRELIRRAYFDLIGLPPSPEEVARFESDRSADAWPRVIDHLLALPQYGERWGRHWLDVARYAQSNGYERDGEKPMAWRYRDYVVRAFNEDKPYDQFIKEQIAGDELDVVKVDGLLATGFQRLGVWDDEPDDKRMAEFDELDDVLSTTGGAFLGLTIGCARCHDHKFDPIPQADYYRLLSFFRNLRLSEQAKFTLDAPNYVPLAEPAELKRWEDGQREKMAPLQARLAATTNATEKAAIKKELEAIKAAPLPFEWALSVRERGPKAPPTHVLGRGNAGSPGVEVQPAFLSVLGGKVPPIAEAAADAVSSGRRRVLAGWIASAENPLTARVMVNRIWHHHFGRGIVPTTSDFGRAGLRPTHPLLLDWLAAEFIAQGWSMKRLHRTILLSQTYQRSSRTDNEKAAVVDPGNELLWRQNLRRLDAEALRDTLLAISGQLNPAMGGRGFFPPLSGEVLAGQSRPGLDWEISTPGERARRSLYAYVRRTMTVPMLDAFDYSNTTSPLNERPTTTVSSQSLLMMNDEFLQEQAAALAARIEREAGMRPDAFVRRGFQLAVGREPRRSELRLARDYLQRQEAAFESLRSRLTFRPDVPSSLSVGYMDKLELFLRGPGTNWAYHRGRWSGAYEGIRTVERDCGPFALATNLLFGDGLITADITLHTACETGGLLFRAGARNHEATGYEVAFEPREQRVRLRRHATGVAVLSTANAALPTGKAFQVKVEANQARLRVWLNDQPSPVLSVDDPSPVLANGRVGVRAWGAPLSVDHLTVAADGGARQELRDVQMAPPDRRARQAFCLLLLNLNEVVYVD
jgi:mono/diheme cytochrome c family protein